MDFKVAMYCNVLYYVLIMKNNMEGKMKQEAPINLRITSSLKDRLIKIANSEERSVSATIRRAIREYVENGETKLLPGLQKRA